STEPGIGPGRNRWPVGAVDRGRTARSPVRPGAESRQGTGAAEPVQPARSQPASPGRQPGVQTEASPADPGREPPSCRAWALGVGSWQFASGQGYNRYRSNEPVQTPNGSAGNLLMGASPPRRQPPGRPSPGHARAFVPRAAFLLLLCLAGGS